MRYDAARHIQLFHSTSTELIENEFWDEKKKKVNEPIWSDVLRSNIAYCINYSGPFAVRIIYNECCKHIVGTSADNELLHRPRHSVEAT